MMEQGSVHQCDRHQCMQKGQKVVVSPRRHPGSQDVPEEEEGCAMQGKIGIPQL